jgi:hypothetical protein
MMEGCSVCTCDENEIPWLGEAKRLSDNNNIPHQEAVHSIVGSDEKVSSKSNVLTRSVDSFLSNFDAQGLGKSSYMYGWKSSSGQKYYDSPQSSSGDDDDIDAGTSINKAQAQELGRVTMGLRPGGPGIQYLEGSKEDIQVQSNAERIGQSDREHIRFLEDLQDLTGMAAILLHLAVPALISASVGLCDYYFK